MVITIQNENNSWFSRIFIGVVSTSMLSTTFAYASDLEVNGDIQATYVHQDINRFQAEDTDGVTLTVKPTVNAQYTSRRLNGFLKAEHTYLDREHDDTDRKDSFTEYRYGLDWSPIDNFVVLSAQSDLSYRNINLQDSLTSNFLLNESELSKTRTDRYSATLDFQKKTFFDARGEVFYSEADADAEQTETSELNEGRNGIDNNSVGARGEITSNETTKQLIWRVEGRFTNTTRTEGRDFKTRRATIEIGHMLVSNWGIIAIGNHEANQSGRPNIGQALARELNTFGAGITYRPSPSRVINISINKVDSDFTSNGDEDEDNTFIGLDVNWAFTERTQITANYGRRSFGNSGNVNLTYNTKHFRSRIRYSEQVTSFSRLVTEPENLGVFVCDIGSTDLTGCFQPTSLSYELLAGEEFRQFTTNNLSIEDDIILRKAFTTAIGYSSSRITSSLTLNHSSDDYIESDRQRETYSINANASYKLGRRSSLAFVLRYLNTDQSIEGVNNIDVETWNSSISFNRTLGENLSTSFRVSYLDRASNAVEGNPLLGIQERRASISATYRFE